MSWFTKIFAKIKISDFVSEIDRFLQNFDFLHPHKSLSQRQEIKKFSRIAHLRDTKVKEDPAKIWEKF